MTRRWIKRAVSASVLGSVGMTVVLVVMAIVLLAPSMAGAAQVAPAWQIVQENVPTVLSPGTEETGGEKGSGAVPRWSVFLTNVGDEEAGTATVTDNLPAGIAVAAGRVPEIGVPEGPNRITRPCTVSGQTVTCEVFQATQPGQVVQMFIPIAVSPSASGEVENQVAVSGGGAPASANTAKALVSTNAANFSFRPEMGLRARAYDASGGAPELAGSHPFMVEVAGEIASAKRDGEVLPAETLRTLRFVLPEGLIVNPSAVPVRCTAAQLVSAEESGPKAGCPVASQVGVILVEIAGIGRGPYPIYSMVAPPGHPAELAFSYDGVVAHVIGGVNGAFHLTAESSDLLTHFPIVAADAFLWGTPSDPGHDSLRYGQECQSHFGCTMEPASPAPFLTMPTACGEAPALEGIATSWLGGVAEETVTLADREGRPVDISGCDSITFAPSFEAKGTSDEGEHPSGLMVHIHQPQDESLEGRATATLKGVKVTLPEGMTLNAAAGNGLSSCSEQQIGYAPEEGKVRFSTDPQTCPDSAKVGTVEVATPLLKGAAEEVLGGSVYVAKPYDNPFDSLLAIYLAIEGKKTGIVAKLAGEVEPNPITGQLTATFTENPELPLEDIQVNLFAGENATLTTPISCGSKSTAATLTPWSTPEGADAQLSDSFDISSGCSSSEGAAPKTVGFTAGTISPLSGSYSPFVLRLSRPDGSQHITGLETTLPEGLLGKLAGISYCPESGIAQAISREQPEQGKLEQASPSCPASSEVGIVNVTAGSGSNPLPVSGHVYLAGPYKGAPLSLAVIVPAVAGPFDLGTVVDRVALNVGEYDAKIHAVADPLPTIRDGIPLDVRSIELSLNRPSFTLNPTSCEAMAIEGTFTTQAGQTAGLNNRFQVGECGRLKFSPKISLALSGATGRTGHPALKATVTYPKKGEFANISRAQVALPHAEFLHQSAIAGACTKTLLAAHACPKKSTYGKARAWSPLLDKPLEGPVYLVGGYGYKLPAMVAELNGQIRLLLVGKVDTGKSGGIRNTFEAVPDAPVSKFVLTIHGGKNGLLENSEDICEKPRKAGASFTAQNGKVKQFAVKISNSCGKSKKGKHQKK